MVMDGGSVVAQQAAGVMSAGTQQQQQQQQQPPQQQAGQTAAAVGVQESTPNATRVAREFVRQYYTILHESPGLLHRFYNEESDFIHGSLDSSCGPGAPTAVRGQQEIHRTILALNFHDCYARIAYVDAQESTNNSVVVQVAGELSNRGSPMRRFLQTFVLVPLSARKYYVRNDIFRYQDEVYTEDTADEDELNANEVVAALPGSAQHHASALPNGSGDHGHHSTPMNGAPETPLSTTTVASTEKPVYHNNQTAPEQTSRKDESRDDSVANNNSAGNNQWDSGTGQQQQASQVAQKQVQGQTGGQSAPAATGSATETPAPSAPSSEATPAPATTTVPAASTTQRSWSQMVKVKPAADSTLSASTGHQQPSFGPSASNTTTQSTFGGTPAQSSNVAGLPQRVQHNRGSAPGGPRVNGMGGGMLKKDGGSPRDDTSVPGGGNDMKNTYNVPDNQQLFVGNIPTSATEQDLQDLFKQYGTVLGFRLQNSKNNQSGGLAGGKASPNFGFVLFDSPEPVQMLLRDGQKTVELNLPGKAPARLNVEEKRPRMGGKGPRGSGGAPRGGRPPLSNGGGGSGGRRDHPSGGDRRPPRNSMGIRAQTAGGHDGHGGASQH